MCSQANIFIITLFFITVNEFYVKSTDVVNIAEMALSYAIFTTDKCAVLYQKKTPAIADVLVLMY